MNDSGRCRFLKEWLDWPIEVHADEIQIERQGRSVRYPFTLEVDDERMPVRRFQGHGVKWVYFMPNGGVELRSATPGYPVIKYEKDSEALKYAPPTIIGKVVGT